MLAVIFCRSLLDKEILILNTCDNGEKLIDFFILDILTCTHNTVQFKKNIFEITKQVEFKTSLEIKGCPRKKTQKSTPLSAKYPQLT